MSASLVGSEMCIRDSALASRRLSFDCWPEAFAPLGLWWASAPVWGAVSYTHLTLPTICSV
eukprot:11457343-Alexandrium_andersonii.AAC.1